MDRDHAVPDLASGDPPAAAGPELYDRDFHAWTVQQAQLLRQGRVDRLDRAHLAEELEAMSRTEADKLRSALRLILLHLLKVRFQPNHRTRSWLNTIGRERDNALLALEDNPSLKPKLPALLTKAYALARREAARETRLPLTVFPGEPPFTVAQTLDEGFLPGPGSE